ncbi:MAG: hydroxyproline-2-epimerase [Planctomycetes bacterium]|jgi:4-hydroxyproline epimerase|nr:hydroxyproline-2-epimerase [Planctomycetota bacterium]MBT6785329.1 hydroxyproline-2-epimerase [Planctomycetota bacterium]MBT7102910.1 hydroxyproline-2-epimerase [Planctomycetota bacterium]MBT7131571.1 hydroxyproline-2-epimerase [Planctomycetota bacterium]MBT7639610.1 hydroxyproline-2-epimerase [Planctomycetota bacterium]
MAISPIHYIDTHTAGEPTRVITGGFPDLGSGSISDQRDVLLRDHDSLRAGIVREPRGHEAMVAALLLESSLQDCQAGVIFFNNVGALAMCGHGAMGVVEALRHMGRIEAGDCQLETPAGVVGLNLAEDGEISLRNVASYRCAADCTVTLEDGSSVTGDIAWGGNWFFIAETPGIEVDSKHVSALTEVASRIRDALDGAGIRGSNGEQIDHIELHQSLPAGQGQGTRSFVLCPGREWDRSPCGTGTSATMACEYQKGTLKEGDLWHQIGVLGTRFVGSFVVADEGIVPTIHGQASLCGEGTLYFPPDDPFRHGIDL